MSRILLGIAALRSCALRQQEAGVGIDAEIDRVNKVMEAKNNPKMKF